MRRDTQEDPPPLVCDAPVKHDKSEQFAWWSSHWADLTAQRERTLEGAEKIITVKPIKPVPNFWKGNFQKKPVPWRKEQLGAYPSYKDFAWPPPARSPTQTQGDIAIDTYLAKNLPWGDDRGRFKGPSETTFNKLVMPADYTTRVCPDFTV